MDFFMLTLYISYFGFLWRLVASIPGQVSPTKREPEGNPLVSYDPASQLHSITSTAFYLLTHSRVLSRLKERGNRLHLFRRSNKILEMQLGPEMLLWHFKFKDEWIPLLDKERAVAGALQVPVGSNISKIAKCETAQLFGELRVILTSDCSSCLTEAQNSRAE